MHHATVFLQQIRCMLLPWSTVSFGGFLSNSTGVVLLYRCFHAMPPAQRQQKLCFLASSDPCTRDFGSLPGQWGDMATGRQQKLVNA